MIFDRDGFGPREVEPVEVLMGETAGVLEYARGVRGLRSDASVCESFTPREKRATMAEPRTSAPSTDTPSVTAPPDVPPAVRRLVASLRPGRRAVIGAGVGATAGLALGAPQVLAAGVTTAPAASAAAAGSFVPAVAPRRRVQFLGFDSRTFARGTFVGAATGPDGLYLDHPQSRRQYVDPGGATAVYDQATWVSPVTATAFAFAERVASWNADTPNGTWVEVLVRGTNETGTSTGSFVLGRWCSADPADGGAIHRTSVNGQITGVAQVLTDTLQTRGAHRLHDWQLTVNLLRRAGTTVTPTVSLVSAVVSDGGLGPVSGASAPGPARGVTLPVPTLSQEVHRGHYPQWDNGGEAWCSATSTAMVLAYWGAAPSAAATAWVQPAVDAQLDYTARNVYDYAYQGCGNWPFNTAYAARPGLEGFVTRLPSFTELEVYVASGVPVVISVSFAKGALTGAGYGTNGHLMVVVGFTPAGDVVVNDPASHLVADDNRVRVTYRRHQLEKAWLDGSGGTAYVIRPRAVRSHVALPLHRAF